MKRKYFIPHALKALESALSSLEKIPDNEEVIESIRIDLEYIRYVLEMKK